MHCRKRHVVPAVLLIGALAGCGGQTTTLGDAIPAVGGAPEPKPIVTPKVGDCRMLDGTQMYSRSDTTPATDCSEQHNAITYAAADVTDEPPFEDAIKKTCADGFAEALGLTTEQANLTIFAWAWYEPSPRDYALGARSYRCDLTATNTDGGEPVPLPAGDLPLLEGEEVPDAYALCRTSKSDQRSLHGAARLAGHRHLRGHRQGVSVRCDGQEVGRGQVPRPGDDGDLPLLLAGAGFVGRRRRPNHLLLERGPAELSVSCPTGSVRA